MGAVGTPMQRLVSRICNSRKPRGVGPWLADGRRRRAMGRSVLCPVAEHEAGGRGERISTASRRRAPAPLSTPEPGKPKGGRT
jgi:hypothetical protein